MPSADPTKFQHGVHRMALVIHNGLQSQTDSPQFEKGSCKRRTEMPVKEIREDTGKESPGEIMSKHVIVKELN